MVWKMRWEDMRIVSDSQYIRKTHLEARIEEIDPTGGELVVVEGS